METPHEHQDRRGERRGHDRDRPPREEERADAGDVPGDGRCASTPRRPTRRSARRADHRPARHLHQRQRHRGLHAAPARPGQQCLRLAGVPLHACAGRHCDKPVVAAVTGAAIGIGTTLLLHCDFVYVSDEARLAMPFVAWAWCPSSPPAWWCRELMGHAAAAEKLLLTGDPFTPEQAVECGIANAVLPAGEVVNHARRMAERFNSAAARCRARGQAACCARPHREKVTLKPPSPPRASCSARRLRSPEAMEAFQAFFQKRKPDFSQVLLNPARARHVAHGSSSCSGAGAGGAGALPRGARAAASCPSPTGEREGRGGRRAEPLSPA